jgi:hypothetical protein
MMEGSMSHAGLRIQFVSDKEGIDALCQAAAAESLATEGPLDVPPTLDQPLDPETLRQIFIDYLPVIKDQLPVIKDAASVAASVAALLASSFQLLPGKKKITIKTPLGTTTVEGDSSTSDETLLKVIDKAGIFPK